MSFFLTWCSSDNNTSVLPAMKAIVISCRNITEDAEAIDPPMDLENSVLDAKDKVSDCLGDMMSAAKNHATYKTFNVELLEDPASDLTNSVFALVDLLNSLPVGGGGGGGNNENQYVDDDAMSVDELKV
jgi:phosphate uptake regulator